MSKTSFDDATPEDRSLALAVLEDLEKEGVEGLKARLERADDDTVRSWVSLERAAPISTEAVEKMFGDDELQKLQTRFGATGAPLITQRLALILPRIIGRLTPLGKLPTDRALKFQFSELKRKLVR
jgi:uncharacterized protein YidB (DUF937 family)